MDVDLDITDDLDVYVEEDNNNNLDAKEEEDAREGGDANFGNANI